MMENIRHINYKSDFVLRERFRSAQGETVRLPDVDFTLRYWVKAGRVFEASRIGGVYTNCVADGDAVLVMFKDHRLGEGDLKHELRLSLDNALFSDGVQNVYYPECLNIQLWQWSSDDDGVLESDLLASYTRGKAFTYEDFTAEQLAALKGDKGDAFTFEDFTPAQLVELKRPAEDAAKKANEAARKAETAANSAKEQAENLKTESEAAIKSCTEAAASGNAAVKNCIQATNGAQVATANAEAAAEHTEQTRQKLEGMADQVEAAARNVPTGLRVSHPVRITLGNGVAQYIAAVVKPDYALQNVLFLSDGIACDVEPDGKVVAKRAGTSRIHVIPTAGVAYYKTINIEVADPSVRMAGSSLRLDADGNIRLT